MTLCKHLQAHTGSIFPISKLHIIRAHLILTCRNGSYTLYIAYIPMTSTKLSNHILTQNYKSTFFFFYKLQTL